MCKFVAYFRVSTARQGASGLGLEAQQAAVDAFLRGRTADKLLASFTEIESGRKNARPQLAAAMAHARLTGAVLVIAKIDRLSRNAAFLLNLQDAGVKFVAADMPEANEMVVGMMAVVAQGECKAISKRTKEALQAARARGVKLGASKGEDRFGDKRGGHAGAAATRDAADTFAAALRSTVEVIRAAGVASANGIAAELNAREIETPRGGKWTPRLSPA